MSKERDQIELLDKYIQYGFTIALAVAFALIQFPEIKEELIENLTLGILRVTLFIVTFIWFLGWIYFDQRELELFEEYIETEVNKIPRLGLSPFLAAILIGVFSGLLLSQSHRIEFFIPLAMLNIYIGLYGQRIVFDFMNNLYSENKKYRKGARKIICEYYIRKQFGILDFSAFVTFSIALVYSWLVHVQELELIRLGIEKEPENIEYKYIAYAITIITIVLHESIIWKWRVNRDKQIAKIEESVREKSSTKKK